MRIGFRLTALVLAAAPVARAQDKTLTVFAAASMKNALDDINAAFLKATGTKVTASYAASSALARQLDQGAPADVFASANTTLAWQLYAKHLVTKPVVFTRNNLVLIVPRSNPARIRSVTDLRKRPKLKLVVAGAKVPIGLYTREVLKRLGLLRVLRKAVSQESDVKGIVGKLALGQADAGFVYATDARTVRGKVLAYGLRGKAREIVSYGVAVVKRGDRVAGRAFVRRLLLPRAQLRLRAAGFLPRR